MNDGTIETQNRLRTGKNRIRVIKLICAYCGRSYEVPMTTKLKEMDCPICKKKGYKEN